jgi:hypothetical protein
MKLLPLKLIIGLLISIVFISCASTKAAKQRQKTNLLTEDQISSVVDRNISETIKELILLAKVVEGSLTPVLSQNIADQDSINAVLSDTRNLVENLDKFLIEFEKDTVSLDLNKELQPLFREINSSLFNLSDVIQFERKSLVASVVSERRALYDMIDKERAKTMLELQTLSSNLVAQGIENLNKTIWIGVLAFVFLILILTLLPMYVGYRVGLKIKKAS